MAFIIFVSLSGYSIAELPKIMAQNAGTGSWFTIMMTVPLAAIAAYILTWLGYMHKNKTLFEYSNLLAGKFFTYIFTVIYYIYFLAIVTLMNRLSCEIIRGNVLRETPIWAVSLVMLTLVYYAASTRLTNIGRLFEFYGMIVIIVIIAIHTIMFTEGDLINIQPFFDFSQLGTYFRSIQYSIMPFLGIELLTTIPFHKENNKKVFLYITLAIVSVGLIYIYVIESCFSIIELDEIVYYWDALFVTIRRLDVPYLQFLRRLDGIYMVVWNMAVFCSVTMLAYSATVYGTKLFPTIGFHINLLIIIVSAFIMGILPQTLEDASYIFKIFTTYIGFIPAALIPTILFILTKVKKYDKKAH